MKTLCVAFMLLCNTSFNFLNGFDYTNNKEFVQGVKNCAVYYNSFLPAYQRVPIELVVAQSVLESNYGKSRFALEGNNLFGIKEYDLTEPHLKPLDNPNVSWGLKMYNTECLSVVNYMDLLTTNKNYMDFQTKLLEMWSVDNYNLYDLIHTLDNYAEDKLYFDKLLNVIEGIRKEEYLND